MPFVHFKSFGALFRRQQADDFALGAFVLDDLFGHYLRLLSRQRSHLCFIKLPIGRSQLQLFVRLVDPLLQ